MCLPFSTRLLSADAVTTTDVFGKAYILMRFAGFAAASRTKVVSCLSSFVGGGGLQEWSSPSLLVRISPDDSPLGLR